MTEIWRPIPSLNYQYEASSEGRIRSVDRTVYSPYHHRNGYRCKGKILTATPDRISGVLYFRPCVDGVKLKRAVHVMVAEVFLGPRPFGLEVDHKDTNRNNCAISNLEYVTREVNAQRAAKNGLLPTKANGRWKAGRPRRSNLPY